MNSGNPISGDRGTRLLLSTSFERQDNYSLEGWNTYISLSDLAAFFSNDAPFGGGSWSIYLRDPSVGNPGINTRIPLFAPDSGTRYIFTYWSKGRGRILSTFQSKQLRQPRFLRYIEEESWTLFTDTLNSGVGELDSLLIYLSIIDSSSVAQFDEIEVLEERP
jgi:hypothetical protein